MELLVARGPGFGRLVRAIAAASRLTLEEPVVAACIAYEDPANAARFSLIVDGGDLHAEIDAFFERLLADIAIA